MRCRPCSHLLPNVNEPLSNAASSFDIEFCFAHTEKKNETGPKYPLLKGRVNPPNQCSVQGRKRQENNGTNPNLRREKVESVAVFWCPNPNKCRSNRDTCTVWTEFSWHDLSHFCRRWGAIVLVFRVCLHFGRFRCAKDWISQPRELHASQNIPDCTYHRTVVVVAPCYIEDVIFKHCLWIKL